MLKLKTSTALALAALLLVACGGGDQEVPETEVTRLEAAHGGPDGLRSYFENHNEADIAAELSKYGIGYQVHDTAPLVESVDAVSKTVYLRAITDCNKFFVAADRAKWHKFNGEYYYIDSVGRPRRAYADLPPIQAEARQSTCQTNIGRWGDAENPSNDYDGGHLIGSQLGGWGGRANIVPQDSNFNRGTWAQLENKMATCRVLANATMRYSISVDYPNSTTLVPSAFTMAITHQTNGDSITLNFKNVDGGGPNGTTERQRGLAFLSDNGCV